MTEGTDGNGTSDGTPPASWEPSGGLPQFYQRPQPLTKERHSGKSIRLRRDYGFAGTANAVPLNVEEFPLASKTYPIVFAGEDPPMPVAILGVKEGQNQFVDEDGAWTSGAYIPAYVRRYPFIFSDVKNSSELVLCIDEASDILEDSAGRPLFVDDEPSEPIKQMLDFCTAFQRQHAITRQFMEDVAKHNLLAPKEMTFTADSGPRYALGGFQLIEEEAFNALPDEVFLDWRRRGWLVLVFCHLLSVSNMAVLGERAARLDTQVN